MKVNVGYAWAQLMRARERGAADKVAEWESVIAGMQAGTIDVGSRTPTSAPAWVTLDVVTGGFATGAYSAGGELREHERALAAQLGLPPTRLALNLHYATSSDADALLQSGRYRIDVPEEGALLVIAWLRARGEDAQASKLLETIAPWFATLRFFPLPAETASASTEQVRLQDLATTIATVAVERRQLRFETMREALQVWKPLRERIAALFRDTKAGTDGAGERRLATTVPEGWRARVEQVLAEVRAAGEPTTARGKETVVLANQLARLAADPRSLSADELIAIDNRVWFLLNANGSAKLHRFEEQRLQDLRAVKAPLHSDLRRVLVARLRELPPDASVDMQRAFASVTDVEARRFDLPVGARIPDYLAPKVARSSDGSLAELVERGVIGSAEVYARVLPQLTGRVRAQMLDDAAARRLYEALYRAFRQRRGLLLVNYQHQVQFAELPWVAALEPPRGTANPAARTALATVSSVALQAFPYTIVPNKLVTELGALTQAAALDLPLVEELAADIFMGSFTPKFLAAAKISARVIEGTLYQRYYAIDPSAIARMKKPDELAELCEQRAGDRSGASVAYNGKILEQAQILTTHNLAVLWDALPLREQIDVTAVSKTCFRWVLARLRARTTTHHQQLISLKNAGYAWRQMMFYAAFADTSELLRWMHGQLERTDAAFRARFAPAMRGLEQAASGIASDSAAFTGRVFTGWSTDRHWLAPVVASGHG